MNYQDKYFKYKNKYIKMQYGGLKSNYVQTNDIIKNIDLNEYVCDY